LTDDHKAVESVESSNEHASKDHVDRADSTDSSEASGIHQDQAESLEGRDAEVRVGECNLDVGVLGEELNTFLKANEAVFSDTEDRFSDRVLASPGLNVLAIVLEQETDHLTDSNAESTEGNRS